MVCWKGRRPGVLTKLCLFMSHITVVTVITLTYNLMFQWVLTKHMNICTIPCLAKCSKYNKKQKCVTLNLLSMRRNTETEMIRKIQDTLYEVCIDFPHLCAVTVFINNLSQLDKAPFLLSFWHWAAVNFFKQELERHNVMKSHVITLP